MQEMNSGLPYRREELVWGLRRVFGELNPEVIDSFIQRISIVELEAGDVLFNEADQGDEIYFVLRGRLNAIQGDTEGKGIVLGPITRGESIGEISMLTGEPRSATVRALRHSVLVKLERADFNKLVVRHPEVGLNLTRLVVNRLRRSEQRSRGDRARAKANAPRCFAIVPLPLKMGVDALARSLASELRKWGTAVVVTSHQARTRLGATADSMALLHPADSRGSLMQFLEDTELDHDASLLITDHLDRAWTTACLEHADEIIVVVDEAHHPSGDDYALLLEELRARRELDASIRLVIMHDSTSVLPRNTCSWLHKIDVVDHFHLRKSEAKDVRRLARMLSRNATGLVLSGGAARGFAHLGAYRALRQRGIDVDCVAGTSMGAGVGSLIALDFDPEESIDRLRSVFAAGPLSDYSWVPAVSLIKGQRLTTELERIYRHPDGTQLAIEDTWKPFCCVATNFSGAKEVVIRRGDLSKFIRASMSLPVYLPPVIHDGEVLIDGGVFNNFPVDVMAGSGVACVIGVDLALEPFGRVDSDAIPSGLQILWRRLMGQHGARARWPTIARLAYFVPTLASRERQARSAGMVDLLVRPDMSSVGSTDWTAIDRAVEKGYEATMRAFDDEERACGRIFS